MVLIPLPKIGIYVQPELQSDHQHLRQRGQTQAVLCPPDDAGLLGDHWQRGERYCGVHEMTLLPKARKPLGIKLNLSRCANKCD